MNLSTIDIYLVHGHIHTRSVASVAASLAACVEKGMTKCVGVANYSTSDMLQMRDELAKYSVRLALNQVEFSVLRRLSEMSGLLETCKGGDCAAELFELGAGTADGRVYGGEGAVEFVQV